MAFKMKYSPSKKTGEGFPYKGKPAPNKFLGKAFRGAAKGIGGLARGIFGGGGGGAAAAGGGTNYGGSGVGALRPQTPQGRNARSGILAGIFGSRFRGNAVSGASENMNTNAAGNVDQFIH
tara:strand:+ start:2193 stop:2555 length:363 start_codon:yes stop_codon:yes gene_type:complete